MRLNDAMASSHILVLLRYYYHVPIARRVTSVLFRRYLSALRSMYASLGRELVAFERHLALRNKGGNHCHINVVGVTPAAGRRAGEAFSAAARAAGFELTAVPPPARGCGPDETRRALQAAVGGGDAEYFMALLPDGSRLVRPLMRGTCHVHCCQRNAARIGIWTQ